jgi:hypothetical protein
VDTLVHAEQFLGLDGEGSITAPAAVCDALTAVQTENAAKHPTSALLVGVGPDLLEEAGSPLLRVFGQREGGGDRI